MSIPKKASFVMFAFLILCGPMGALSTVHSEPNPNELETRVLDCLTTVYPLNLTHYNITLGTLCTLSPAPPDTFFTQSVGYNLNSPDSNLVADFMFKDGHLYQLSLSIINGSVATERTYDNLTDAARDFLLKYQVFSGAYSTDLIQLLDQYDDEGKSPPIPYGRSPLITLGNISFWVSHFEVPTSGTLSTHYNWLYSLNGADDTAVSVSFANNTFSSFSDWRQIYYVDSNEAINVAADYAVTAATQGQINNADIDRSSSVAEFHPMSQNGTLKPCWNVTLELNRTYPGGVSTLQMNVWADTGEVFNFNSTGIGSLHVNSSARLLNQGVATVFLGAAVGIVLLVVLVAAIAVLRHRRGC